MKNVFNLQDSQELKNRVNQLNNQSQPKWGKMDVGQMLAHCNVAYEMAFEPSKFKKAKGLKKWAIKTFLKPIVVGPKPYKRNSPTATDFKIVDAKDFEKEKERINNYIDKTQRAGATYFEGRDSVSMGSLKSTEWNALFYKHLNHHLKQFDV